MAIQLAGGTYTDVIHTCSGTKADLANWIEDQLNNSGWTTISGHHTTNILVQSVSTTADSLQYNVRIKDNSGTCVQLSIESTDGSLVGGNSTTAGGNLNPVTNRVYRILASKYGAMIYDSTTADTRSFVWFGTTFLSPITTITKLAFLICNSASDGDTNLRAGSDLRTQPTMMSNAGNGNGNFQLIINNTIWEVSNNASTSTASNAGAPRLMFMSAADFNMTLSGGTAYRWFNDDIVESDVLLFVGTALVNEAKCVGQLYDTFYLDDSVAIDTTMTFNSHTYRTPMASNLGLASNYPRGGLWIAVS